MLPKLHQLFFRRLLQWWPQRAPTPSRLLGGCLFIRPSPRPGEAREGVRLSLGGVPGRLGWLEQGVPRLDRPSFPFCFVCKREQLHGALWGHVWKLLLLKTTLI